MDDDYFVTLGTRAAGAPLAGDAAERRSGADQPDFSWAPAGVPPWVTGLKVAGQVVLGLSALLLASLPLLLLYMAVELVDSLPW